MRNERTLDDLPNENSFFAKPSLLIRVKSMMIDGLVLVLLMYLATILLETFEVESGEIRGSVIILVFLYEPIFVSINKTIGQAMVGIKVCRADDLDDPQRISIVNSLLRYIIKLTLGIVSLLTVHSDPLGKAIHDKAAKSVMIFA